MLLYFSYVFITSYCDSGYTIEENAGRRVQSYNKYRASRRMIFSLSDTLHKIKSFRNSSFPILSLYLPVPETNVAHYLLREFEVHIQDSLDIGERTLHAMDISNIRAYLLKFKKKPEQKGMVIFAGGLALFEVINVDYKPTSMCTSDFSPYTEPLERRIDVYKRYLVIVGDRQKGKFFTIYKNRFEDQVMQFRDETVPQNVKKEGMRRAGKTQSHIRDHLDKHLKELGERALDYIRSRDVGHVDGVIVASRKELLNKMKESLPGPLKNSVIGEFNGLPDLPVGELTEKAKRVFI